MFGRIFLLALVASVLSFATVSPSVSAEPLDDARATTEALSSAVLAAIIDFTENVSEDSVAEDSAALTALFRSHRAVRLLGEFEPLGRSHTRPRGGFERRALAAALEGIVTQEERGRNLRTVAPLAYVPGCDICHANYVEEFEVGDIIGAASYTVRIR